jgi:signal transduction histidine kinase
MRYRDWLRPPRHLIALFLVLTLVPSLLLIAFGWRLLRQDLELERQQADASRERAADVIVAALEQSVGATEAAMRDAKSLEHLGGADDAVAVVFTGDGIQVFPPHRLLFHPVASPGIEAPAEVFADGETLEFRDKDPLRAASWFADLARSSAQPVRAGALVRLARNLRKAGNPAAALDTYGQITQPDTAVGGVPADLLARWARCELLSTLGREPELRAEAQSLAADLTRAKWRLDRDQFSLHLADARRWAGDAAATPPAAALALAESAQWLYERWRQLPPGERFSGRAARTIDGALTTLVWQGTREQGTALIAGARYVNARWVAKLAPLQHRDGVRVSLADPESRATPAAARRRSAADTGLPWTVLVEDADGNLAAAFQGRRAIWLGALGAVALLIASGSYVVVRAVSRELKVARLQSEFVSAVSHEFRTPLTSLRQLSEMLIDRPGIADDRRRTYYEALARQTDRLHRLVESLLDFGRIEAGTSPYRLAPLDAGAFIRDLVHQFATDRAARGHEVRLEMPAAPGVIAADPDALTNALWNLLDNAVKYSPGSPIVWVDVAVEGSMLAIRVRDRGLGIPAAEQREIFGKFVRGATARAGNIDGTGIGLAMVTHIASAHRGSVSVESEPGAGSTFTLHLPLIAGAAIVGKESACLES